MAPATTLALIVAAWIAGCAAAPPRPDAPPDPDAEALASSESFLHCFERSGAECRPAVAAYRAWAAVRLLGFLRDASPVAVMDRLASSLAGTRDDDRARRALIADMTRVDADVHDANCQSQSVSRFAPGGTGPLAHAALERAEGLGLLRDPELSKALLELPALVEPMAVARIVEVACGRSRRRFFLLLAPWEGSYRVVSLDDGPPGLAPPGRPAVVPTLGFDSDVATPYIPVPEEAL